ncbi:unnamed protein product [Hymenolepis diminuta]|uniref:Uncharacterized protein n=1 Tax=Hymenolepis diminuta TaxID=6216 RepID=A0A3P6ZLP7_HYMDI|nr:unnamed protein product [Hymenolepis diminuta]
MVQDEQDNLSIITAIEVELDLTNNLPGLVHPQVEEPCFAEKLPKVRKTRRLRRHIASFHQYTSSNFFLTYLIPQEKNGLPMRISFPLALTTKHNLNLDAEDSTRPHILTSPVPD